MFENIDQTKVKQIAGWLQTGSLNLFGRPFSGKDTQGKRLAQLLHAPLIGGGDIIRSGNNEEVKEVGTKGKLAPSKEYLDIVLPYLSQEKYGGKPLILSSVGRWDGEQESIVKAAGEAGHPLRAVIYLNIDDEELYKRWQAAQASGDRGMRSDDARSAIAVRLSEFQNKTLPVLDYYRDAGLLIDIDGSASPDDVTNEIISKLAEKAV